MSSVLEILSEQELNFRKENLIKQIKKIDDELGKRNFQKKPRIKVKVNIK
jgi:hypothetical protein